MTEIRHEDRTFEASDGYPFHVAVWPAAGTPRGGWWCCTGSRAIRAGTTRWAGRWPRPGTRRRSPTAAARAPTSRDRGHAPSGRRLVQDLAEWLEVAPRPSDPPVPIALAGISWGGKLVVITAASIPSSSTPSP